MSHRMTAMLLAAMTVAGFAAGIAYLSDPGPITIIVAEMIKIIAGLLTVHIAGAGARAVFARVAGVLLITAGAIGLFALAYAEPGAARLVTPVALASVAATGAWYLSLAPAPGSRALTLVGAAMIVLAPLTYFVPPAGLAIAALGLAGWTVFARRLPTRTF